jgi:hypothetical protein
VIRESRARDVATAITVFAALSPAFANPYDNRAYILIERSSMPGNEALIRWGREGTPDVDTTGTRQSTVADRTAHPCLQQQEPQRPALAGSKVERVSVVIPGEREILVRNPSVTLTGHVVHPQQ